MCNWVHNYQDAAIRIFANTIILLAILLSGCSAGAIQKETAQPSRIPASTAAVISQANPTTPSAAPQKLRVSNHSAFTLHDLRVRFPEDEIDFGDVPPGVTSGYQNVPHGVYRYAAYDVEVDGQKYEQPVVDWIGENPMEGSAFTYVLDADPTRWKTDGQIIRLVQVIEEPATSQVSSATPTLTPSATLAMLTSTAQPSSVAPPAASMTVAGQTQAAGVGSSCWAQGSGAAAAQVCTQFASMLTPSLPLKTGTPYSAHFHLAIAYPPQSLGISVSAVSPTEEISNGKNDAYRLWKPAPGWAGGLPLKTEFDYQFMESTGLYVIQLTAGWKDLGRVTYGFLVQVGDGNLGAPASATASPSGPMPTPETISLPRISPILQLGKGTATVMSLSPDGRWLAMIKPFGIYMVDIQSQKEVWFKPFTNQPTSLDFSPNGLRLAIGSTSNILAVLDTRTGAELFKIEGEASIHASWSPDGTKLVTSGDCEEVSVWDASTGSPIATLQPAHCSDVTPGTVNAVWSLDGKRIYIDKGNGRVEAWDAAIPRLIPDFQPEPLIDAVDFDLFPSPTEPLIAVNNGQSVAILNGDTGKIVQVLSDPSIGMLSGESIWSPDGKHLITNSSLGPLNWDLKTGKALRLLEGYDSISDLTWSADGQPAEGVFWKDGRLVPENITAGSLLIPQDEFSPVSDAPIYLKWGGQQLLTYAGSDLLKWDRSTGQLISRSAAPVPVDWPRVQGQDRELSPDATRRIQRVDTITTLSTNGTGVDPNGLAIVDIKSGQVTAHLDDHAQHGRDISAWSPDGTRIVSGDSLWLDTTVLWDAKTGKLLFTLPNEFDGQRAAVNNFFWSPDGSLIAGAEFLLGPTGEDIGMLVVWDAASGKQVRVLTAGLKDERVDTLAWSLDGKWLAAGLGGGSILLWDMTSYRPIALLVGHAGNITGFSWSDDSIYLAANAADGTLILWKRP